MTRQIVTWQPTHFHINFNTAKVLAKIKHGSSHPRKRIEIMATFEVSPVKKESQPLIKKVDYEAAFWGELIKPESHYQSLHGVPVSSDHIHALVGAVHGFR